LSPFYLKLYYNIISYADSQSIVVAAIPVTSISISLPLTVKLIELAFNPFDVLSTSAFSSLITTVPLTDVTVRVLFQTPYSAAALSYALIYTSTILVALSVSVSILSTSVAVAPVVCVL
jgi:hypothetical protein